MNARSTVSSTVLAAGVWLPACATDSYNTLQHWSTHGEPIELHEVDTVALDDSGVTMYLQKGIWYTHSGSVGGHVFLVDIHNQTDEPWCVQAELPPRSGGWTMDFPYRIEPGHGERQVAGIQGTRDALNAELSVRSWAPSDDGTCQ